MSYRELESAMATYDQSEFRDELSSPRWRNGKMKWVSLALIILVAVVVVGLSGGGGEAVETKEKIMSDGRNATISMSKADSQFVCSKRLANEYGYFEKDSAAHAILKSKSKLWAWMKRHPATFKDCAVYVTDDDGKKQVRSLESSPFLEDGKFGNKKYRIQMMSSDQSQALFVWPDNTVATVDEELCRVTGVYLPVKTTGGLDERIAADVQVRTDKCGRSTVCERNGMDGTCDNSGSSCPPYFSKKRDWKCRYDGWCVECACRFVGVCQCPGCPGSNCPTHYDRNCPLRDGSPCSTNINLGAKAETESEAEVIQAVAGFVAAASQALPPMLSTPIAIVTFVIAESAGSSDTDKFNQLMANIEQAIDELRRCIKADIAKLVRDLGVKRDIDAVKGKLLPSRLEGQTAATRMGVENYWLIAEEGCKDLGALYERYRLTTDWHTAAVLLPSTVEAVKLCGMVYAMMVSDLATLGQTGGTRFRNLRLDFRDMMRKTIQATAAWRNFLELSFYKDSLCGHFPDLQALVPPQAERYRVEIAKPVLKLAMPLAYGKSPIGKCIEDRSSRVLRAHWRYHVTDLTMAKCNQICSGYKYYGLEIGAECFCGNELVGEVKELPIARCSTQCTGNSNEYCGGPWALMVHLVSQSCIRDRASRVLNGLIRYNEKSLTIKKCSEICVGFKYFGVEVGSECFCGNELVGAVTVLPASSCSTRCLGNSHEHCGGSWALNLFLGRPVDGCIQDNSNRVLRDHFVERNDMTVGRCKTLCSAYKYYGVENGKECFCGNKLFGTVGGTVVYYLPQSRCSIACHGDSTQKCGGAWAMNIYTS